MTSGTSNGTGAEALLGLDGLLTDDQRAWRDRARAVASVIAALSTRQGRGLPGLVTGRDVTDARAEA